MVFHFRTVLGHIHPVNRFRKFFLKEAAQYCKQFKSKIILQSRELKVFIQSVCGHSHVDIKGAGFLPGLKIKAKGMRPSLISINVAV